MTVQVMWMVPVWRLTFQLLFTKCSSFKSNDLIVTVKFTPFEAIVSFIIPLHVKTSNITHIFKYLLESKL